MPEVGLGGVAVTPMSGPAARCLALGNELGPDHGDFTRGLDPSLTCPSSA